jgi:TRAP-type transport system periplasmic protein
VFSFLTEVSDSFLQKLKGGIIKVSNLMNKGIIVVLISLFLLCFIGFEGLAVKTIRLGHVVPTSHPEHLACEKFKEIVEEKSDGQINVEIYPNNQLGDQVEQLEGIRIGTQEMLMGGTAMVARYYTTLNVMELPYLLPDNETYFAFMDSETGKGFIQGVIDNVNIRPLGYSPRGNRQLTSNKPVYSIEDVQGLKVRVPEAPVLLEFWKSVGASPVPMGFSEVYTSLATGTLDAQENPLALIVSAKFYEVQDYVIFTNHTLNMSWLLINEDFYQGLSDDLKVILNEAGNEITQFVQEINSEREEKDAQLLKEEGMEFIEVDISEFREASKDLYKKFAGPDSFSEEVYKEVQDFVESFN